MTCARGEEHVDESRQTMVKECIQAFISHHDSPIKRDKKVDMSDLPPAISLPQPIRKRSESAGSTRGASGSPDSPQLKPMGIGEMNGDRRERAMGQIGLVTALCEARVPVPVSHWLLSPSRWQVSLEAESTVIESYHLRHIWACLPAKVSVQLGLG